MPNIACNMAFYNRFEEMVRYRLAKIFFCLVKKFMLEHE